MVMNETVLFFLFQGRRRAWNPLRGFTPPSESVFEVRSFPGKRVALGSSMEEAKQRLRQLLEKEMRRSGAQAWHAQEKAKLSHEEQDAWADAAAMVLSRSSLPAPESLASSPCRVELVEFSAA